MKKMLMSLGRGALAAGALAAAAVAAQAADLKVGLSVSLSGPNSSLGVPYAKGMQAALAYKGEIAGRKVDIWRRHPFHGQVKLVSFSLDTLDYAKFTGAIEDEVTART